VLLNSSPTAPTTDFYGTSLWSMVDGRWSMVDGMVRVIRVRLGFGYFRARVWDCYHRILVGALFSNTWKAGAMTKYCSDYSR